MSIFEMLIWVVTIAVAVYLIIGVYHLLSESGVTKQIHVKVALWLIVIYTVGMLIAMVVSAFV